MDQGEQGLQSTLDIFRKKGIGFAGAGKCLEDAKDRILSKGIQ